MDITGIPEEERVEFNLDLDEFNLPNNSDSSSDEETKSSFTLSSGRSSFQSAMCSDSSSRQRSSNFDVFSFPRSRRDKGLIQCQAFGVSQGDAEKIFSSVEDQKAILSVLDEVCTNDQAALMLRKRRLNQENAILRQMLGNQLEDGVGLEILIKLNKSLHLQEEQLEKYLDESTIMQESLEELTRSWSSRSFSIHPSHPMSDRVWSSKVPRKSSLVMEKFREHQSGDVARKVIFQVAKVNRYRKNSSRVLELDTAAKVLQIKRKTSLLYVITSGTFLSAEAVMSSSLALVLRFYKAEKKLRDEKGLVAEFNSRQERERFLRLVHLTFPNISEDETFRSYTPSPLTINDVGIRRKYNNAQLPFDAISQALHKSWTVDKLEKGWSYGKHHDDKLKTHPDLVPFESLGETEKQRNLEMVQIMLETVFALGFEIKAFNSSQSSSSLDLKGPFNLPSQLLALVEYLAENLHDVWAQRKMQDGWVYGERNDFMKKTHPLLISYLDLTEEDRESDRQAACAILSTLISLGYHCINPKNELRKNMTKIG